MRIGNALYLYDTANARSLNKLDPDTDNSRAMVVLYDETANKYTGLWMVYKANVPGVLNVDTHPYTVPTDSGSGTWIETPAPINYIPDLIPGESTIELSFAATEMVVPFTAFTGMIKEVHIQLTGAISGSPLLYFGTADDEDSFLSIDIAALFGDGDTTKDAYYPLSVRVLAPSELVFKSAGIVPGTTAGSVLIYLTTAAY